MTNDLSSSLSGFSENSIVVEIGYDFELKILVSNSEFMDFLSFSLVNNHLIDSVRYNYEQSIQVSSIHAIYNNEADTFFGVIEERFSSMNHYYHFHLATNYISLSHLHSATQQVQFIFNRVEDGSFFHNLIFHNEITNHSNVNTNWDFKSKSCNLLFSRSNQFVLSSNSMFLISTTGRFIELIDFKTLDKVSFSAGGSFFVIYPYIIDNKINMISVDENSIFHEQFNLDGHLIFSSRLVDEAFDVVIEGDSNRFKIQYQDASGHLSAFFYDPFKNDFSVMENSQNILFSTEQTDFSFLYRGEVVKWYCTPFKVFFNSAH